MSLIVALAGGIASGKSTVGQLFADHGVPVEDADVAARRVVEPGTDGLKNVVAHFGDGVLQPDGTLNRRALREIVFGDPRAREALEGMLHPLIHADLQAWLQAQTTPYAMLMLPLLKAGGFATLADRILVVDAPVAQQISRLMARDDIDQKLAQSMVDAQDSRETRLAMADDVIRNDGNRAALHAQVAELHARYLELAA